MSYRIFLWCGWGVVGGGCCKQGSSVEKESLKSPFLTTT